MPRRRPVGVDGFEGHDRLIVQHQSIRGQRREEASFDGVEAPRAPDDHVIFHNFDARVLGAYPCKRHGASDQSLRLGFEVGAVGGIAPIVPVEVGPPRAGPVRRW